MQSDRRETGDEHDLEMFVVIGRAFCEFDPVETRHDDVGQEQIEARALEALPRRFAVAEIGHLVTRLDERSGQEPAKRFVVFSEKYARHGHPIFELMQISRTRQMRLRATSRSGPLGTKDDVTAK